jgi:hypothetical protein
MLDIGTEAVYAHNEPLGPVLLHHARGFSVSTTTRSGNSPELDVSRLKLHLFRKCLRRRVQFRAVVVPRRWLETRMTRASLREEVGAP